jgi:hypothetical protein
MLSEQPLEIQLDPEDIILLILQANSDLLGRDALAGITRLEKLLFLLQKETDFEGVAAFFEFSAYNFGPFSKEVYEAAEFLEGCDLIVVKERLYPSYYATAGEDQLLAEIGEGEPEQLPDDSTGAAEKLFFLTAAGQKVASKLREAVASRRPRDIEQLDSIVRRYGNLPLNQLIRYVYRRYPDMTVKSIHPEARRLLGEKDR